jgi:hypothetical protein
MQQGASAKLLVTITHRKRVTFAEFFRWQRPKHAAAAF